MNLCLLLVVLQALILAAGSAAIANLEITLKLLPNGGWVVGSEFNSTLTYGSKTLSPTSPYAHLRWRRIFPCYYG